MSVLLFILILSFLVLIHELGHYIAAKRSGVIVEDLDQVLITDFLLDS